MAYGFIVLLLIEVALLGYLTSASERASGEAAIGDAMGFFAVLLFSAVIDLAYGIVWFVIRHHHHL